VGCFFFIRARLGLASRAPPRPALILLAARPLEEWVQRRPRLDPIRWTAACIADDVAYGLGVWRGCATTRTLEPVRPTATGPRARAARDMPAESRPPQASLS
jgi:hypothetical protein